MAGMDPYGGGWLLTIGERSNKIESWDFKLADLA